jgi:hypothetical protein
MTESSMVLIPLLITFLSVFQISGGVLARTRSTNVVQGITAQAAISGGTTSLPGGLQPGGLQPGGLQQEQPRVPITFQSYPLPGGGSLTIGSASIRMPSITPLLPGGDSYEATGVAVTE